jgi:glycine dehydrogenase
VWGCTRQFDFSGNDVCGVLLQYPATNGSLIDYSDVVAKTKAAQGKVLILSPILLFSDALKYDIYEAETSFRR